MARTIPEWLLPAVSALGVDWPDGDEDQVSDLGGDFRVFSSAVTEFGESIADLLEDLSKENSAHTLNQLKAHWTSLQSTYVAPAGDAMNQAGRICDDGYNTIYTYKGVLLGYLDVQLGAIAWSGGIAGVIDVVGKRAIHKAVEGFAEAAIADVRKKVANTIEDDVKDKVDRLVKQAVALGEEKAYKAIASRTPEATLTSGEQQLIVSSESLGNAIRSIKSCCGVLSDAISTLVSDYYNRDFKTREGSHPDSRLRQLLTAAFDIVVPDLEAGLKQLAEELAEHVTGIVNLFGDAVGQADLTVSRSPNLSGTAVQPAGDSSALDGGTVVTTWQVPSPR